MRQADLAASATQSFTFSGYTPSLLLLGTVDRDNPVSSIVVEVDGKTVQNVQSKSAIQVQSKIGMKGILGADVKVGQVLKIADGRIDHPGKDCVITLTNSTASPVEVRSFSEGYGGNWVQFNQGTITSREKKTFFGIEYMTFDDTNFDQADITFIDGHSESKVSLEELGVMLVMTQATDTDGELAGFNVVNLIGSNIQEITLYAGSGGNLTWFTIDI